MLKRISPSDVELGMFIHKLEGSWFKHPFWKSRFLLESEAMLRDLNASEVDAVVIDVAKGYDVRTQPQRHSGSQPQAGFGRAPAARRPPIRMPARREDAKPDLRSVAPLSMAREFGLAKQAAGKSRKVISRVFLESRLGKSIKTSYVEPVIEEIFSSIQRNPHAFNGLMRCKRDNQYIYRHALAVSALMISLPRLDGFGLIERLRAGSRHQDRPILVLTTESSDEKKQRARDAGATGWIIKPFDPEKLATAVRRVAP